MRLLGYTVEGDLRARCPITRLTVHKNRTYKHLVWGRLSVVWGPTRSCEHCGADSRFEDYCDECHWHFYCECGQELCDSYGSPGDGLCRRCS